MKGCSYNGHLIQVSASMHFNGKGAWFDVGNAHLMDGLHLSHWTDSPHITQANWHLAKDKITLRISPEFL